MLIHLFSRINAIVKFKRGIKHKLSTFILISIWTNSLVVHNYWFLLHPLGKQEVLQGWFKCVVWVSLKWFFCLCGR